VIYFVENDLSSAIAVEVVGGHVSVPLSPLLLNQ
jgi:hypothetical protein